jgi:hypothetical protein
MKKQVLSFLLESKSDEIQKAFLDGCGGFGLKESRSSWKEFRIKSGFVSYADLLTYAEVQHKLKKSKIYTAGLTIQHADVSGYETCAWRGLCTSVCVLDNGNGRYDSVQKARNVKTQFLAKQPIHFMRILGSEIKKLSKIHEKVLIRLNTNSDVRWHMVIPEIANGVPDLWNVFFYDYTKNPAVLSTNGMVGKKYRMVYSVNENSDLGKVVSFIERGGTAAIVTNRKKNEKVLDDYLGLPVIDGDRHDDRYHESGVWVDLAAKGRARSMPDFGFVQNIYA